MNPITQVLKESEDRNRLGQIEVATWMRGYGIDDNDELKPEEVQDLLDAYRGEINISLKEDQIALLSAVIKEIEGMIDDNDDGMWTGRETAEMILEPLKESLQELQSNK